MRRTIKSCVAIALMLTAAGATASTPEVRVRDLTMIEGVRSNPLIGYGLVVGLEGTGDGNQSLFTMQSLGNLLRRQGIDVAPAQIRVKNIAAVMVTADLPPFARPSQQLDVAVSSIGDCKSLQGGQLLMTPLQGPDGQVYAVAQGPVSLGGGFSAGGGGNQVTRNHQTSGLIQGGATVERRVPLNLADMTSLRLLLNEPDFTTAARIVAAINSEFGSAIANAEDSASVRVDAAAEHLADPVAMLSRIQSLTVQPDRAARVVVNERTGTVVMGHDVRITAVSLAHGSLTVEVDTTFEASQPNPASLQGKTVVVPDRAIYIDDGSGPVMSLPEGVSVQELVSALNTLGASPRDMIAILQAIRAAGALHAELVLL